MLVLSAATGEGVRDVLRALMAVIEEARGLGLGRRLIEHALDYFRREGLHVAMIETMAIYCLVIALLLLFANPYVHA